MMYPTFVLPETDRGRNVTFRAGSAEGASPSGRDGDSESLDMNPLHTNGQAGSPPRGPPPDSNGEIDGRTPTRVLEHAYRSLEKRQRCDSADGEDPSDIANQIDRVLWLVR